MNSPAFTFSLIMRFQVLESTYFFGGGYIFDWKCLSANWDEEKLLDVYRFALR